MSQYVPIQLDKVRQIRLAYKAQKIVENITGKAFSDILCESPTTAEMGIMLYAGIVHEDKELTLEKVEDMIDEHLNSKTLMEAITEAIDIAFETKKNESKQGESEKDEKNV